MLEVGHIFKIDGYEYCLLQLINYYDKKIALFSREKDKIAYIFYEIIENEDSFDFKEIKDEQLNFQLLDFIERN